MPHSIYPYQTSLLAGTASGLRLLNPADESDTLLTSLNGDRVSFTALNNGAATEVFYVAGTEAGRIIDGAAADWEAGDYHGPGTTRSLVGPPGGHLVAWIGGRMWMADGQHIYLSEPMNPYLWDLNRGRMSYGSRVRMMAGLNRGAWVSDCDAVYWVSFNGPEWEQKMKLPYPALEGVPSLAHAGQTPFDNIFGPGLICPTIRGICFLGEGGIAVNLTEKAVEVRKAGGYPLNVSRFAGILDKNRYICCLHGADRIGLICNISNFATTQQDCYLFNSFAEIDGVIYGADDEGIHRISEAGTTAVNAEFSVMADVKRMARLSKVYLGGEFAGDMQMDITCDDNVSRNYALVRPRYDGNKNHDFKVPVQRDNGVGTFFKFRVANINGADFSIDRMECTPSFRERK